MESPDNNLSSKPSKWHYIYLADVSCLRIKPEYKHFGVFGEDFFFLRQNFKYHRLALYSLHSLGWPWTLTKCWNGMHTPPQLAYEVLKVKARDHACTQTGLHYHHSIKIFKLSDVGFYLYAVNMFYYHWLINKLLWPMAGQNKARLEEI